jgi:predicted component of type VI protein secretion system
MSNLIPISAKMVGTTAYRKMYLARHVEKRIAAFEARVEELEDALTEAVEYLDYSDLTQICATSALHLTMARALKPSSEGKS